MTVDKSIPVTMRLAKAEILRLRAEVARLTRQRDLWKQERDQAQTADGVLIADLQTGLVKALEQVERVKVASDTLHRLSLKAALAVDAGYRGAANTDEAFDIADQLIRSALNGPRMGAADEVSAIDGTGF